MEILLPKLLAYALWASTLHQGVIVGVYAGQGHRAIVVEIGRGEVDVDWSRCDGVGWGLSCTTVSGESLREMDMDEPFGLGRGEAWFPVAGWK